MSAPRWSLHFAWGRVPYDLDLPEVVIGRGDTCSLQIDEPEAADEPARFVVDQIDQEEQVWIEDAGSGKPTLLNGAAVKQRTQLRDGDFSLQIGRSSPHAALASGRAENLVPEYAHARADRSAGDRCGARSRSATRPPRTRRRRRRRPDHARDPDDRSATRGARRRGDGGAEPSTRQSTHGRGRRRRDLGRAATQRSAAPKTMPDPIASAPGPANASQRGAPPRRARGGGDAHGRRAARDQRAEDHARRYADRACARGAVAAPDSALSTFRADVLPSPRGAAPGDLTEHTRSSRRSSPNAADAHRFACPDRVGAFPRSRPCCHGHRVTTSVTTSRARRSRTQRSTFESVLPTAAGGGEPRTPSTEPGALDVRVRAADARRVPLDMVSAPTQIAEPPPRARSSTGADITPLPAPLPPPVASIPDLRQRSRVRCSITSTTSPATARGQSGRSAAPHCTARRRSN